MHPHWVKIRDRHRYFAYGCAGHKIGCILKNLDRFWIWKINVWIYVWLEIFWQKSSNTYQHSLWRTNVLRHPPIINNISSAHAILLIVHIAWAGDSLIANMYVCTWSPDEKGFYYERFRIWIRRTSFGFGSDMDIVLARFWDFVK